MAILKVAQLGHPVLRAVAAPIEPPMVRSPQIRQLIDDMLDTMEEYDGAGLAAPQVHVSLRLVVLTVDDESGPEAWINPELTPLTDATGAIYEGCLSVAGLRGRVSRPTLIHARFIDRTGTPRAYILQGFPAIVAQHECDHLDGVLYVDRVDPRTLAFLPEFRKFGPLHRQLGPSDGPPTPDIDVDVGLDLEDLVAEVPADLSPAQALQAVQGAIEREMES